MQSLYKVIKNASIVNVGKKEIITQYSPPEEKEVEVKKEVNAKEFIDNYESLAKTMLENSRKKGEQILSKAYEEAQRIEDEAYPKAYEKGYEEGKEKGYNDAYEEAYTKNIEKATKEKESMLKEAETISENIIRSAKEEYIKYLEKKKIEIKRLVENIIENTLKSEIKDSDSLNNMIIEVVENEKNSKTIIIRCRSLYKDEVESKINLWKEQNVFKGDIFIIGDDSLEEGKAIIEKDNGKIIISMEFILEKIKEILCL
ncbi:hypothetical protein [Clostridium lundense]|uniref:FliH/SctL family protein n=1 Tax=Clostridium lundense TaxID=319475 RepID=UPI0004803B23|nr:hypothetical protein [Clostridium lundense]